MSIPERQLDSWSNQGAVTTAKSTHQSVRTALSANSSPIQDRLSSGKVEVYLQGSYKNSTNVRADSDVDIIVQLNSTWGRDLSALDSDERQRYDAAYSSATYLWDHFRSDVLAALRAYYDASAITEGSKAIRLEAGSSRLAADIVPALLYRHYRYFRGTTDQSYTGGIKFYERPGRREIINYPKTHYENGVTKNAADRTDGWYKPVIRMFKNARTRLVDQGIVVHDRSPSYFLECLLYNVPDDAFRGSFRDTYVRAVDWLDGQNDMTSFV